MNADERKKIKNTWAFRASGSNGANVLIALLFLRSSAFIGVHALITS
jgi:hypothetical protein